MPHCLRLFWQLARRADSRARASAGNRSEAKMPMMAITTSNSTNVNPLRLIELSSITLHPSLRFFVFVLVLV
jgi:hypothetical protein